MANELLIKINADAKNAKKAFDDVKAQTEDLESSLSKAALVSGIAFAAFTAEIYSSVKAFEEARKSSVQLTNALQNQGIFTTRLKNQYEEFAQVVEAKTGIDDDTIIQAQAVAQTFLGQTEITQDLTAAIADLAAAQGGDLNSAAEKIAKTIGTGTNAFAKQGLVIREGATQAERYAAVLEFVQTKSGGLAAELNKADGYAKALATSFGNFQEAIGQRFAPLFEAGRKVLIQFFDAFSKNSVLADVAVSLIAAGAAVSGIVAALAVGVPAFTALAAAATAAGVALNVAFIGIPLAIGAVVAAITLFVLNWDKAMAAVKAAAVATVTLVSEMFGGLTSVLSGVFTLDVSKAQSGLRQLGDSFKKAKDDAISSYQEITAAQVEEDEKQNEAKKKAADKLAATERQHQANLRAIRTAELELLKLQTENASADLIDLKKQEIEILKALDQQKTADEIKLLQQRREENLALQEQQRAEDIERQIAFAQLQAETKAELDAQGIEVESQLRDQRIKELQATALTEADIDRQLQEQILKRRIESRNQELADRKRYGEAVAIINKALYSDEVQGAKSATGELVALQQSKNATLKQIGKVAAVANITISTAESAMNIYRGFSTIPIVGPALGVIGAAAAVAFGAERISQVTAAADGGLLTGGIPGVDSIPVLAQQGELIVPKQNFDEVVGAVQTQREGGVANEQVLSVLNEINSKFDNPRVTNISGDVMADDAFVDSLINRINDAIDFRNQRLSGTSA